MYFGRTDDQTDRHTSDYIYSSDYISVQCHAIQTLNTVHCSSLTAPILIRWDQYNMTKTTTKTAFCWSETGLVIRSESRTTPVTNLSYITHAVLWELMPAKFEACNQRWSVIIISEIEKSARGWPLACLIGAVAAGESISVWGCQVVPVFQQHTCDRLTCGAGKRDVDRN